MFTLIYHEIDPKTKTNTINNINNIVSARWHNDKKDIVVVDFLNKEKGSGLGAIPTHEIKNLAELRAHFNF